MPRSTPADLADEIRTRGGRWSLTGARLRPPGPRGERTFDAAIAFGGGRVWSEVQLDSRAVREARAAAELLKRSGYEILSVRSNPFHARRPVRGMRELEAEVRRLEALSFDRGGLASFPPRVSRPPGLPSGPGPFRLDAFDRLLDALGWTVEWAAVGRTGPALFVRKPGLRAGAACSWAIDGVGRLRRDSYAYLSLGRRIESVDPAEVGRLLLALRERLEPLGYTPIEGRGPRRISPIVDKAVRSLPEARRERARLDRVLFGD